jgi:hypothetical protein
MTRPGTARDLDRRGFVFVSDPAARTYEALRLDAMVRPGLLVKAARAADVVRARELLADYLEGER